MQVQNNFVISGFSEISIISEISFFSEISSSLTTFCCNFVKFRHFFIKIHSKNDEIHAKNSKICEILKKIAQKNLTKFCKISEFGAVQRNADLVDLEKNTEFYGIESLN